MNNKLGIFGGLLLVAFGIFWFWLLLSELLKKGFNIGTVIFLGYGIISLILGIYILFNLKKEDNIEQIKKV